MIASREGEHRDPLRDDAEEQGARGVPRADEHAGLSNRHGRSTPTHRTSFAVAQAAQGAVGASSRRAAARSRSLVVLGDRRRRRRHDADEPRPRRGQSIAEGASPDDTHGAVPDARGARHPGPPQRRQGRGREDATSTQARAIAAAAGLPRTGKGFELFDGSNLGQSSFARAGQLPPRAPGRAVAQHHRDGAGPGRARAHRARQALACSRIRTKRPTASVALHLHPGQTLTAEQVRGMRQLVAASVEGLRRRRGRRRRQPRQPARRRGARHAPITRPSIEHTRHRARPHDARARRRRRQGLGRRRPPTSTTARSARRQESLRQREPGDAQRVAHGRRRRRDDADRRSAASPARAATCPGARGADGGHAGSARRRTAPAGDQELRDQPHRAADRRSPTCSSRSCTLAVVVDYKAGADGKPARAPTRSSPS